MSLGSLAKAGRSLATDIRQSVLIGGDTYSRLRLAMDAVLLRAARLGLRRLSGRTRSVALKRRARITYGLDRGDLQSIREVWMEQHYRLPAFLRPSLVVDLGANIGLTSVWMSQYYPCKVIAVEPSPRNARLARENFRQNAVRGEVIDAAIGPTDSKATFVAADSSNLGRVEQSGRGIEIDVISMNTLLRRLPHSDLVDLLKIDIEGAEGELLLGDARWLGRVRCIIAEFHPALIDCAAIVRRLESLGFVYLKRQDDSYADYMDIFVRSSESGDAVPR